jgi:hypothetical protein
MASKYNIDLTGRKFGHFTVIKPLNEYTYHHGYKQYQKWSCICDCGSYFVSNSYKIIRGETGCRTNHDKNPILIGRKFGDLTVINRASELKHSKDNACWWNCLCSCGDIITLRTTDLTSMGRVNCSISKHSDRTIPAKKSLYLHYQREAKKRGLIFEITFDDFIKLTSQSCVYCNQPPTGVCTTNIEKEDRTKGIYVYNGLDRIDNNIGYVLSNVIPCCKNCNLSKSNRTPYDFLYWVFKLYNNINKKGL